MPTSTVTNLKFQPPATDRNATPAQRQWTVCVVIRLPDSTRYKLHPTVEDAIPDRFGGMAPVLSFGADDLRIAVQLNADSYAAAGDRAGDLANEVATLLGLDSAYISAVSVEERDEVGEQFLGSAEVAQLIGVSAQRLQQLRRKPDFPEPRFKLAATPVWVARDIQEYNDRRLAAAASRTRA